MKKVLFFIIIATMAGSCGVTNKHYMGEGLGLSDNEQVSKDMSELNSAINASKKNNLKVTVNEKIETVDENGHATTNYTSTKEATSVTTFVENNIETKTKRNGKNYKSISKFGGTAK